MFQTYLSSCSRQKVFHPKDFFGGSPLEIHLSWLVPSFPVCTLLDLPRSVKQRVFIRALCLWSLLLSWCATHITYPPSSTFPPLSLTRGIRLLPYLIFVADAVDTIRGEFFVMRRNLRWQNRHTILAWYLFWWDLPCFVAKSVFMVI